MSDNKKYYWLKLKNDFFNQKEIKKLRKIAGGDTYTIIYLKMQLLSLKNNGLLFYDGIEDTFAEELALDIDEEPKNIEVTLLFLKKCGFIEQGVDDEYFLTQASECMGTETASTIRSRRHRDKLKALQCNTDATKGNTEKEIEKDIEKELDIEIKSSCRKLKFTDEHMNLAQHLFDLIRLNNPNYRLTGTLDKWANEFRLMIDRDKRTIGEIKTVLEWSQRDSFWKSNILSAGKLREKFDQLSLKMNQLTNNKPKSQLDMIKNLLGDDDGA